MSKKTVKFIIELIKAIVAAIIGYLSNYFSII